MAGGPDRDKTKVLIVEDEVVIGLDLVGRVRDMGYEIVGNVTGGREAVEMAGRARPDLILMDIVLDDDLDGIQAAELIRANYNLPTVFITAYADEKRLARAKLATPFGYILKPFNDRDLKVTIEMALYVFQADLERRKSEKEIKLNETRLKVLHELNQMGRNSLKEICVFTLEQGVRLTSSQFGYLNFLNQEETAINFFSWSESVRDICRVQDRPTEYQVAESGLWGEAIRLRRPVITNDYANTEQYKKGLPQGHVHLARHMNVPVFEGDRIVALAGVANKENEYDETDVRQLQLLLDGMWRLIQRKRDEEFLRDSEEKFRYLVERSPLPISILDRDGVYLYVNQKFTQVFGYSIEDIPTGKDWFKVAYPDPEYKQQVITTWLNDLAQAGEDQVRPREFRVKCKDGNIRDILFWPVTMRDKKQFITYVDVTERREYESELRKSRLELEKQSGFLANILESLTHPFYIIDPETHKIVMANKSAQTPQNGSITCYALAHGLDEPCHGDDNPCPIKLVKKTKKPVTVEHNHKDSQGNTYSCEVHAYPIMNGEDQVNLVIEYILDITKRKKAEEEILCLARALEQIGEAVVITDPEGVIQYVNPAFERISGYQAKEAIGLVSNFKKSGFQDRSFYQSLWEKVKKGESWSGHIINQRKDGTLYDEDATISPVFDVQGRLRNLVAVKRDVSREIFMEKQLRQAQKLEAIGTLAGGIAHDFNNILSAFIGYVELAIKDLPSQQPPRQYLDQALIATHRARNLIQQILSFSRRSDMERRPVQFGLIVKECYKFLRASLPATIDIRVSIAPEAGAVLADPTQLHQIVMNLATNGAQAMMERGGVLEIDLRRVVIDAGTSDRYESLTPGTFHRLTIRDTGNGIDPDVLDRIFEPFYTTKERGRGTGLGLSVVHGIVKGNGGAITVESTPGTGSVFNVYLPLVDGEITGEKTAIKNLPKGKEHVLVVDDEESLVDITRQMLEYLGYKVSAHTSSLKALRAFKANPEKYDLVVTDQTMPRMTGLELSKKIIKYRSDLPIVLCTGFSETVTLQKAQAAGISELAFKPIVMEDLAVMIRNILDRTRESKNVSVKGK